MKKYNKYYSGFIPFEHEVKKNKIFKGKYFIIRFESPYKDRNPNNNYELIIYAKNLRNAQKVQELIYSGACLQNAHLPMIDEPPNLKSFEKNIEIMTEDSEMLNFGPEYAAFANIPRIAEIATKCSFRMNFVYALIKYKLACILHSNYLVDLNPHFGDYTKLKDYLAYDHIRMGYAIVLFYSVIEQLGLELRASPKKPSIIGINWNPRVKNELETRLTINKININEKILWHRRCTPSKIEKKKKPIQSEKPNWTKNYRFVRDTEINLVDAIRITSWIRSSVVSHKLKENIKSISIYDVANANFLARRLFLEKLGFLKFH